MKDFTRFKATYNYKDKMFKSNMENIKKTLQASEEILLEKLNNIQTLWEEKKPFTSDLEAREALNVLDELQTTIMENKNKLEKLNEAKELLDMEPIDIEIMFTIIEDSKVLNEIWLKVEELW